MLNIEDNTKIIASNLAMMYNDGSKYSVTVYDADGQLASGVEVTFKVDGKKNWICKNKQQRRFKSKNNTGAKNL